MLPAPVTTYVASRGWGRVTGARPVSGGCINDGRVLTTESGPWLFLKTNASAPADMFLREAEGLAALAAAPGAPRVPAPLMTGDTFLLLEYLAPAPHAPDYWPSLGQRLAQLHRATKPTFGFDHDNYIGATPQPNPPTADGYVFFGESRLRFQALRARQSHLLSADGVRRVDRLIARLPELVPPQPASLIHGDLWSGNIIPGPNGQACLIDPAAHFAWAEADLAMTTLFGHPPQSFFAAYNAERPLEPDYQDRFELYNLYHLLNHLNLFGTSYLPGVEALLAHFA